MIAFFIPESGEVTTVVMHDIHVEADIYLSRIFKGGFEVTTLETGDFMYTPKNWDQHPPNMVASLFFADHNVYGQAVVMGKNKTDVSPEAYARLYRIFQGLRAIREAVRGGE